MAAAAPDRTHLISRQKLIGRESDACTVLQTTISSFSIRGGPIISDCRQPCPTAPKQSTHNSQLKVGQTKRLAFGESTAFQHIVPVSQSAVGHLNSEEVGETLHKRPAAVSGAQGPLG